VRFQLEQGIDQFLDIGSGMPTAGNVHEVTQRINPAARVAYVDIDPVVIAHSQAILRDASHAIAVQADARRPQAVLAKSEITDFLDFTRPIGVLAVAILHFVPDNTEARDVLHSLTDAVADGSYVALTHATADAVDTALAQAGEQNYQRANAPFHFRTHAEVAAILEGLELVEPGLVYLPLWRPDVDDDLLDQPERSANYGALGVKR
jgi:trans-aconitate methyltransferase